MATTHLKLSPESPSLSKRSCPHGVTRKKRKAASDAERRGRHDAQGRFADQVIEQLARLVVDAHERDTPAT